MWWNGRVSALNELNSYKLHYGARWRCRIHSCVEISEKEEKKGLVKASFFSVSDMHTKSNRHTLTYAHTNKVSVSGLRLWLLKLFSWEITLNKFRPEEFCLGLSVFVGESSNNSIWSHDSPLLSINISVSSSYISFLHIQALLCTSSLDIR